MKEIEVLVPLQTGKGEALALLGRRATPRGVRRISDTYYDLNTRTRWLRVREQDGRSLLTYKVDHLDDGVWQYSDEEEVEIANPDELHRILRTIGLLPLITVQNERHLFSSGPYEIAIEDVKGLGLFLEVELRTEPADGGERAAKERVRQFIASLGLHVGVECAKGKAELLLDRRPPAPTS